MLTDPEPDRNIEGLTDDEIYSSIRYLEPDPYNSCKQSDDRAAYRENNDNGVVICVCLYIAMLGSLAIWWFYLR